jgi:hypothetical protein
MGLGQESGFSVEDFGSILPEIRRTFISSSVPSFRTSRRGFPTL